MFTVLLEIIRTDSDKVIKQKEAGHLDDWSSTKVYFPPIIQDMDKIVIVNDLMQRNYQYMLQEPMGENFQSDFKPELTPGEMLKLGVFGGKYMTDCTGEFPAEWFLGAKLCHEFHDPGLNFFGINASKSLKYWHERGWIYPEDPRGWFQWYCRYYMGRRSIYDEKQIKRWRMMVRHIAQIKKNCPSGVLDCRKKQRQALLHWAYDSRRY